MIHPVVYMQYVYFTHILYHIYDIVYARIVTDFVEYHFWLAIRVQMCRRRSA